MPDTSQNSVKTLGRVPQLSHVLTLFSLCAIALAQPLYTALGDGASFFVAHNAGAGQILTFALIISLGFPLVLIACEWALGKVSQRAAAALHFIFTAALAGGFVIMLLNKVWTSAPLLALIAAGAGGVGIAALLARSKAARELIAFAVPSVVVFPILFLFFSPVSALVMGGSAADFKAVKTDTDTPVVFLIFDEFSPLGLLDSELNIDPIRFPNFAELASSSTRYSHAASASQFTTISVPAVLTGVLPTQDEKLPNQSAHPNNLFTLFGQGYSYNVNENFTQLCPAVYCDASTAQKIFSARDFWSDIKVITQHIFYPKKWAEKYLPSLTGGWNSFVKPGAQDTSDASAARLAEGGEGGAAPFRYNDPLEAYARAVDAVEPGPATLDFIHSLLPHQPWVYLPDGRRYQDRNTGLEWDTQAEADEVYHRYLMQLGTVDKLLGDLIRRLKETGKYEEAIIVVAADHGLSFQKGTDIRGFEDNPAVLHIPMFIKLPGQTEGKVDERFVLNIDIVPTIADALDIEIPWEMDGQSLIDESYVPRTALSVPFKKEVYSFSPEEIVYFGAIPNRIEKFGELTPLESLAIKGRFGDYIGQNISQLQTQTTAEIGDAELKISLEPFNDISLSAPELPVLLSGQINISPPPTSPISIGLALNGKVSAIVPLTGEGQMRDFSALLPPADFTDGRNTVDAVLFLDDPEATSGAKIINITVEDETFALSDDWTSLIDGRGQRYPLKAVKSKGLVSITKKLEGKIFFFHGWAADASKSVPAEKVVILKDEAFVASLPMNEASDDIVKQFGDDDLSQSRFRIDVSQQRLPDRRNVRVFAIYPGGYASELTVYVPPFSKTPIGNEGFTLSKDWSGLTDAKGQRYPVKDLSPRGLAVAEPAKASGKTVIHGWAADIKGSQPANRIALLQNGKYLTSTPVDLLSLDLVEKHDDKRLVTSRFRMEVEAGESPRDVRVFAIFDEGFASELMLYIPPESRGKITDEGFEISSAADSLTDISGRSYPIRQIKPAGVTSHTRSVDGRTLSLYGWAADASKSAAAEKVIVFKNGAYVESVPVDSQALDVVQAFNDQALYISRFRVNISVDSGETIDDIRLFGLYPGGYTSELDLQ